MGKGKTRGHGGKRAGAGRPKKVTDAEWFEAGALCEKLHRARAIGSRRSKIDAATKNARRIFEEMRRMSVAERRKWLGTGIDAYEDHQFDVLEALRKDQGLPEIPDEFEGGIESLQPKRGFSIPTTRPKGARGKIIRDVARKTGLSESTVAKCWKDFRWLLEKLELDDELDGDPEKISNPEES